MYFGQATCEQKTLQSTNMHCCYTKTETGSVSHYNEEMVAKKQFYGYYKHNRIKMFFCEK